MTQANAAAHHSAHARNLRQRFAIDESSKCIELAQTTSGRLLMALAAWVAVSPHFGAWQAAVAIVAAMLATALPRFRAAILFGATWSMAVLETALGNNDTLDSVTAVFQREHVTDLSPAVWSTGLLLLLLAGIACILNGVRRRPQSFLARRPLLTVLALEAVLCGVAMVPALQGLPRAMLWSLVFVLTPYLWFLPYAIVDQRSRDPNPALLQLAVLRPFWSPSYLPFGKGAAFLRKNLAKTPHELAVTQLKSVKLLVWANLLFGMKEGLRWVFQEQMHIPSVDAALNAFLLGQPYPLGVGWAALIVSTAKFALQIAIWAHLFIGIARLAGYRLPRGSWRPLESRTLMDYFNRFHYYFKELLVDFFFVPTFFKVFRPHPRLRMFFATFMAAGVGNAVWHFVRDIELVATAGPVSALETFTSYAFYCWMLAMGVGISQVRANLGIRPPANWVGRVYSFLLVWSFVVCMHVFSDGSRNHTLVERGSFLASLFGVNG